MQTSTLSRLDELLLSYLSFMKLIMIGLPILLGLGIGFLIIRGDLLYALVLALLIPIALIFTKRPFIGVILWLLLMPLFSALPNPDVMYWGLHRLMIPFTLCMAVLIRLSKTIKHPIVHLGLPELSIAIFAGLIPVSILLNPDSTRWAWMAYLGRLLVPFCMYLIMRLILLDQRNWLVLQWTVFIVAVIQCAIGFLSWMMPQIIPHAWRHLLGARTAGSLEDPAVYTSILVFCATLLLYAAMQRKAGLIRLLFLIICGASFICVFISLERGSWVAGALVLLGLLILYPKPMLRFLFITGVVILILGAGFLSRQVNLAYERIGALNPIYARVVTTDAMLEMIKLKPVFGWGYNTLDQNIQQYYRIVGNAYLGTNFTTSHNTYITILTEVGLVGFLLYLLPCTWLLKKSYHVFRQKNVWNFERKSLLAVLWLGSLQNFIVSNFMDMRFFPIGVTLWWISLGLIANLLNQYTYSNGEIVSNKLTMKRLDNRSFEELLR